MIEKQHREGVPVLFLGWGWGIFAVRGVILSNLVKVQACIRSNWSYSLYVNWVLFGNRSNRGYSL